MRNDQLYVDGVLVDIDENTQLTMGIKSLLLGDVSKWENNATWSVKLPKTVRNRRVLGYSDMVQSNVSFPYVFHEARYFRNGVEVISDGSLTVLEADDEAFHVTIVWGVFHAFSGLMKNEVTLNMLESDEKILFEAENEAFSWAKAQMENVVYAEMDCERYVENDDDDSWTSGAKVISDYVGGRDWSAQKPVFGGKRGSVNYNKIPMHPCAKVSWILKMIREQIGVGFVWSGEAREFIDSLILPVIKKKASSISYEGGFSATIGATTDIGYLTASVTSGMTAIKEQIGESIHTLHVEADSTIMFDVSATCFIYMGESKDNNGKYIMRSSPYIEFAIIRNGEKAVYIVGKDGRLLVEKEEVVNGRIEYDMTGRGAISVAKGDMITFELKGVEDMVFQLQGGTIIASVGESDEVPLGGFYPIAMNLPEIKVIDFVKFLSVITGTFPKQCYENDELTFVSFDEVWGNIDKAVDWTHRLIAPRGENSPQDMTFRGDFCQHNLYKWKKDETVRGNYDGDLAVRDETLEAERTVYEFPFAATDGNNVPLYEKEEGVSTSSSGSSGNLGGTRSVDEDGSDELPDPERPTFEECEPRVLRMVESDGKAAAVFDIDMQRIINSRYYSLFLTANSLKVIRESIRIKDTELKNFDETIPVYLAQYGQYFAILEMKVEDNGLAEVTMMQLITE